MITVELRFPAGGRFHATPWGRHVNEGAVEWPVEPWRLLRALIATWWHKAQADIPRPTLERLITALASAAPTFHLPSASLGHTRHYMPFIAGKKEGKTKLFDAFVHIAYREAIGVRWDVALTEDEQSALELLLHRLGYLGRAESIVEARLVPSPDPTSSTFETRPLMPGEPVRTDQELVQVLAPQTPQVYDAWLVSYRGKSASGNSARSGKKATAILAPDTLFKALLADTGELRAAGWSLPPGARRVAYVRPADAFKVRPTSARRDDTPRPTVARYALASAVLPSITSAVSVGDRVHQALVSRSPQWVFTGHDTTGAPLREHHQHASILPECDLASDRIRFLTVHAPGGFDADARRALTSLRNVWGHGGHDIQLVLLGFGEPRDFAGSNAAVGQSLILQESAEWVSLTPFIPTRHGKMRHNGDRKLDEHGDQIGGPAHDLRRLLTLRGPAYQPVSITLESHSQTKRPLRWLQFQRRRGTGEGARAGESGFGFRIRFAIPVPGPLALGYGAHFGLGLFIPAAAANA